MVKGSRRRIAAIAAASWVLATAVTSLVVWQAVAVFSDGASTNVLSAPQVSERLNAATATSAATSAAATDSDTAAATSAAPSPSSDDSSETTQPPSPSATEATRTSARPATTAPTAEATPVVTTWTVSGGTLSISCQAQVIALVYASPQDGWRVETEKHGTDRIDVNFQRVGQGTEVRATCVSGVPQQTNQSTDGDH